MTSVVSCPSCFAPSGRSVIGGELTQGVALGCHTVAFQAERTHQTIPIVNLKEINPMKWLLPAGCGGLVLALAVSFPRAQDTAIEKAPANDRPGVGKASPVSAQEARAKPSDTKAAQEVAQRTSATLSPRCLPLWSYGCTAWTSAGLTCSR